jgi:hypothetical protein
VTFREALIEDVRSLAGDLKALLEDPKERKRKERAWAALYSGLALGFTLLGRRLAPKAWAILTGEQPPVKAAAASSNDRSRSALSPRRSERVGSGLAFGQQLSPNCRET